MPTSQHHPHADLHTLQARLSSIHEAIAAYQPLAPRPPVLDSSLNLGEDRQWLQQENVPGLKSLMEAIRRDLDVLEKFLADPNSAALPALSTNAPYLIAVWNAVLCAPPPVVAVFKFFAPGDSAEAAGGDRWQRPRAQAVKLPLKVDVVADNGRRWIRVNTMKNDRILAEFREIDSYITDSDDDSTDGLSTAGQPQASPAPIEFDNSLLRLGRSLLHAAAAHPISGTTDTPHITLRLTRLDPAPAAPDAEARDPRIARTVRCLSDMGIDVQLGKQQYTGNLPAPTACESPLRPSARVNLDLSVLIALISDLTHAPLPISGEQANARFVPSQRYREWKMQRVGLDGGKVLAGEPDAGEIPTDGGQHSRALADQALQEMAKGLLQEIFDRLLAAPQMTSAPMPRVEFWTTPDARDRCLRIVAKIGGPNERRRAHALFCAEPIAEEEYWRDSRFPQGFISFLPVHIHPSSEPTGHSLGPRGLPLFFKSLAKTCTDVLAQDTIPHPRALPDSQVRVEDGREDDGAVCEGGEIQRATVMKANPRLTAHTVQSMLWGAALGWTTLTANKTSVRAILREMKATGTNGGDSNLANGGERAEGEIAAIWIVDPRSLAEGMRSDNEL